MNIDLEGIDADVLVSSNEIHTAPKIIDWLKRIKLNLIPFPLPIGDYLIIGNPNVVVERKKTGDWLQSKRDGRLYDQKKNMDNIEGAIPIIIIHGHWKQVAGHYKRWKPKQVCGTLASMIFSDIPTIKVPDEEWFAYTIQSIHNLITKEKEWKPHPVKMLPRVNSNEEWGLNMFMSADKVGPTTAMKLALQFDTVKNALSASKELLQQTIGDITGGRLYEIVNTPLEEYCKNKRSKVSD